jgi:hypothetical protein
METKYEIDKFPDGRKKLLLRFFLCQSNFRQDGSDEYTWCPSFDEVEQLRDTLLMTDAYNNAKKRHKQDKN